MAEILPKVYYLIRVLSHFLMKNVPYGTFPIDFNVSNLENVPYGTYQIAGLVSEAIDQEWQGDIFGLCKNAIPSGSCERSERHSEGQLFLQNQIK